MAIIGSVLTLIGQATIGLWSTISENQESRLIEKIRKDEPLASNIKTKVIESSELASLKTEVTDARKDIGIIKQSIARIEGRLNIAQAQALGIPNPNIQSVSVVAQEKFNSKVALPNKRSFFFQFTIVKVEGDVITIRTDGRDWNNNQYSNNLLIIRAVPGTVYNLSQAFPLTPGLPKILFAILGRPTPKTLDIAIGTAGNQTG